MTAVRVLPEDLANQIAAGEVVERPSSVVKELIENSLDAGARRIVVDIEQGGVSLIRVADDGAGMNRDDASLAVLRHATSKLAAVEDLLTIRSFGFRGEALPSIASVSRFELRTRQSGDAEGTLVRVHGGASPTIEPVGSAAGTVIEVRELFYNVPARRKFLKATATESAKVSEVLQAAALGDPAVTLILSRDGRMVAEWLRTSSREERALSVFEGEELRPCKGERGPLRVEAYLSQPERARSGATWLSLVVNGRPVRDRTLARSIALAYGSVLESGKYPVGVVYLDIPCDLVDVNVHPQKVEVRFADGRSVSDALYRIVRAAFEPTQSLPPATAPAPTNAPDTGGRPVEIEGSLTPLTGASPPRATKAQATVPSGPAGRQGWLDRTPSGIDETPKGFVWGGSGAVAGERGTTRSIEGPELAADAGEVLLDAAGGAQPVPYPTSVEVAGRERPMAFGGLRFVAQVRHTFLVCEGADGLYLLDQHAAAERVTFHRLKRSFDSREVASQKLLFPEVVTVAPSEAALIEEQQELIARTGLDARVTGATTVVVHAVPLLLAKASAERLFRDLLGEVSHAGERSFSGAVDRAIATMACHGSLRAGDPVPAEEAQALLAALDDVDFAGHCPHGRPVVMRIGWGDLEHKVGRR